MAVKINDFAFTNKIVLCNNYIYQFSTFLLYKLLMINSVFSFTPTKLIASYVIIFFFIERQFKIVKEQFGFKHCEI